MLNEHYEGDGEIIFKHACKLGCEGIVSKRLGSLYRSGRSPHWVKVKNPNAPAVKREAEEDWGRRGIAMREVVIAILAAFLIGIMVAAPVVHFLL